MRLPLLMPLPPPSKNTFKALAITLPTKKADGRTKKAPTTIYANVLQESVNSVVPFVMLKERAMPSGRRGWTLVQADGLSLGWAKGDGNQLKNHYPKALRRPV